MRNWTRFTPEELERRRMASIEALRERDNAKFEEQYQAQCDTEYWTKGQCCFGCDHWQSAGGNVGQCGAAGLVSGEQVMRSLGIEWWTCATPGPDLPYTKGGFHCAKFRDDFDWSALDPDYLSRVGAIVCGVMQDKPKTPRRRD